MSCGYESAFSICFQYEEDELPLKETHPVCENEYPKENAVFLNQSNEENYSTDAGEVSVNPSMMTVSDIENIILDISNSDKKPVIIEKTTT